MIGASPYIQRKSTAVPNCRCLQQTCCCCCCCCTSSVARKWCLDGKNGHGERRFYVLFFDDGVVTVSYSGLLLAALESHQIVSSLVLQQIQSAPVNTALWIVDIQKSLTAQCFTHSVNDLYSVSFEYSCSYFNRISGQSRSSPTSVGERSTPFDFLP